jgi:hypothetical protein
MLTEREPNAHSRSRSPSPSTSLLGTLTPRRPSASGSWSAAASGNTTGSSVSLAIRDSSSSPS